MARPRHLGALALATIALLCLPATAAGAGARRGMQIAFEAPNARTALTEGPSKTILFQHAGGETAGWKDGKVDKEGTHPVVFPAAGSHATFYDSAVYVENGQGGSGVGCDNTAEPPAAAAQRIGSWA